MSDVDADADALGRHSTAHSAPQRSSALEKKHSRMKRRKQREKSKLTIIASPLFSEDSAKNSKKIYPLCRTVMGILRRRCCPDNGTGAGGHWDRASVISTRANARIYRPGQLFVTLLCSLFHGPRCLRIQDVIHITLCNNEPSSLQRQMVFTVNTLRHRMSV